MISKQMPGASPNWKTKDLVALNQVKDARGGNQAVIAAGTGLGEAACFGMARSTKSSPAKGGHCDFAPRNELEIELLRLPCPRDSGMSATSASFPDPAW